MASIALRNIRCIDYLAYGTIFTRVTFRPKIKLDVFFFRQKSPNEHREVVGGLKIFCVRTLVFWSMVRYSLIEGSNKNNNESI
jgi:hypothetical protein